MNKSFPNYTPQQKFELARTHLASKQINFGNPVAQECGEELFVAGITHVEEIYKSVFFEFKETYIRLFQFHCSELNKESFKRLDIEKLLDNYR